MQDLAAVVIAIVSLVGTLLSIGVTTWLGYFYNERKRKQELKKVFAKYRDALLLASHDLQSRLYNIADHNITNCYLVDGHQTENLLLYTAFAIGQYLGWVHVFRRRTQFLQFETGEFDTRLALAISNIGYDFSTNEYSADNRAPLMLWRGDQMAIGEIMTVSEGEELSPMGYGAFQNRWAESGANGCFEVFVGEGSSLVANARAGSARSLSQERYHPLEVRGSCQRGPRPITGLLDFREWFRPIVEGVVQIAEAKKAAWQRGGGDFTNVPDQRVRRLQHRLVDLIEILDPKSVRSEGRFSTRVERAALCYCSQCGS